MHEQFINDIRQCVDGMDVIIISVTSQHEKQFWLSRLEQMRGQVIKENAIVLSVVEDWQEGAGNALGSFYAFQKAHQQLLEHRHLDLFDMLGKNSAIGLYHTAGKGTRLAPMTGCEHNSKSRIKLAGKLFYKERTTPITLLEAVIKQTSILAPHRKGRLSVFWGDQLFIPNIAIKPAFGDVDLLVKPLKHSITESQWIEEDYSKYGLVIIDKNGGMQQLEKLSYDDFKNMNLKSEQSLALSLGSFSLSEKILKAFLDEFSNELSEKKGFFNTDPHLWMPLTLPKETYLQIQSTQGENKNKILDHFNRMQTFKEKYSLFEQNPIGFTSMGEGAYWWDYGNLKSFYDNHLKLTEGSQEATCLKSFFGIAQDCDNKAQNSSVVLENSILINCSITCGKIKDSVLIDVTAHEVNTKSSLIICSSAQNIESNQAILYNCLENGKIKVVPNQIRSDNFSEKNGHIKFFSTIHPHLSWDKPVEGNPLSFKDLHQINQKINPAQGQHLAQTMLNKIKQAVFDLQK